MKRVLLWLTPALVIAAAVVAAGCGSLATPEAPSTSTASPGSSAGPAANVSQQVKDGGQLYVSLACVRCHAPNGVGGVPNQLNVGGDSTIPPLNNQFRDPSEQFRAAPQITQILTEGSIVSKKPGVINMPSWKGVINDAQANAIAAYILAGFPNTGATYDPDPAKPEDIYSAYACIDCHGQVGGTSSPSPAPNPKTADKVVPALRNPDDNVPRERASLGAHGGLDPGSRDQGRDLHAGVGSDPVRRPDEHHPAVCGGRAGGQEAARAGPCVAAAAQRRGLVSRPLELGLTVSAFAVMVAQGIPLAPPLGVRLIALAVVEVVLLTTAVLLYIRWAQFKKEPLDEWWEGRKKAGFSPRTRALMEEEERERLAAEQAAGAPAGDAPAD